MNEITKIVIGIVAALGGAGGVAKIINELAAAAKLRAEAKKASEDGHRETQRQLQSVIEILQKQLSVEQETAKTAVAEAARTAAENETLRDRVKRLENLNDRLAKAVPASTAGKKEKV